MRNPLSFPISETLGGALERRRPLPALQPVVGDGDASALVPDDLSRDVYCVLGMPVDAIDMASVVRRVQAAAASGVRYLISTPNLNFLVGSRTDVELRDSLQLSELCTADGMPIVWIGRLLGAPFKERVAGADMFDALQAPLAKRLSVFFFGGSWGAAAAAGRSVNDRHALECVGSMYPGYCSVDELSKDHIIDAINASKAQLLVVALGAAKGQAWLKLNHHRLQIPVRAHLGAVINYQAGSVRRAPAFLRRAGCEWLWRIKEESHLWRRYWNDGRALLGLLVTRVLPLAARLNWHRRTAARNSRLVVRTLQDDQSVTLHLSGHATARHAAQATVYFRNAVNLRKALVVVDLSELTFIDARFFGLLLMVRKRLAADGATLRFAGASRKIAKLFALNELGYLIAPVRRV